MINIDTSAELYADEARNLPDFGGFALRGVKEQVAAMLDMIGRVDGLFSTYSKHDISHIDAMLGVADWLIPPSTAKGMTPIDWLLIVLAIYFHDLGLVVSNAEYRRRSDNSEYCAWFGSLDKTAEGREYLARTVRMTSGEKERFFFQEYVRKGHASRIREWITARHSRSWGPEVTPISTAVAEALSSLPPRFREHLADICESHHKDDLDRTDKYPLAARYGNHPQELANVQYAAVILRTADLLHITKDRTPSIMYQSLGLSDPKAVEEWDKQIGTFAVGPKGRRLVENDPETAVIVLNADFSEERPLFALQEYISYADRQIQQSKRWIDKSQESPDADNYSFPWHTVKGDVRLEGVPPFPLKFELDRGRLLDLLVGHTIYDEPTVAVRELLQNAIDAVRYDQYLLRREAKNKEREISYEGKVAVHWDADNLILRVEDNGIGMDLDTIKYHLMRVGASFYNTPQFAVDFSDFTPISRFGIGILTCFMISDDVEIITCRKDKGYRIRMTSVHSDYLLRELLIGDPLLKGLEPHGTRVSLRVRNTIKLPQGGMRQIVRHWIVLPEFKVRYQEPGKDAEDIGFASPEAALEQLFTDKDMKKLLTEDFEWITKERDIHEHHDVESQPITYKLAFAVRKIGLWPERHFLQGENLPAAVCIEGIRVADSIPGFRGLSGVLSVRGNRRLRTTVSRAGLERDEEFEKTALICADLLVDHIKVEVERIATKAGSPLSQASSAAKWLSENLIHAARRPAVEYVRNRYRELPAIVFERVDEIEGKTITNRSIVSQLDIDREKEFWTIESRLLDSLGIISRDLGRELSLNEFLITLAPEFRALRYSPLIPDAREFREALVSSHKPISVEFSCLHQQSAIRWVMRESKEDNTYIDLEALFSQEALEEHWAILRDKNVWVSRYSRTSGLNTEDLLFVEIAPLSGDDAAVKVVRTRTAVVLRPNTAPAELWTVLRNALMQCAQNAKISELSSMLLEAAITYSMYLRGSGRDRYTGEELEWPWKELVPKIHKEALKRGVKIELPDELSLILPLKTIFDASAYWRDWFNREKRR